MTDNNPFTSWKAGGSVMCPPSVQAKFEAGKPVVPHKKRGAAFQLAQRQCAVVLPGSRAQEGGKQ